MYDKAKAKLWAIKSFVAGASLYAGAVLAQAPALPTYDTTQVENYIKTNVVNAVLAVGGAMIVAALIFMLLKWVRKLLH